MKLTNEGVTRKVDNLGRLVIPKAIRARFNIQENDEMAVFTFADDSGNWGVAFQPTAESVDPKYANAVAVLEELGCVVPDILKEKIEKEQ